jgi:hypothetical protein
MTDLQFPEAGEPGVRGITAAFDRYLAARAAFLTELGLPASNRDPLSEFSERLVEAILGGRIAPSRVQAHYDVQVGNDRIVQVKYLANPADAPWVNEHTVVVAGTMTDYVIVFFESLVPVAAILFAVDRLADVYDALGKKHPGRGSTLQLTQTNQRTILDDPARFTGLGVEVYRPPTWQRAT